MKSLKLPKQKTYEVPGGMFKRFLAFVIDLIIVNIVIISPFRGRLMSYIPETSPTDTYEFLMTNPGIAQDITGMIVIILLFSFLYFVLFDWKLNQTVGKMILKVFVVNEMARKKPITFWQSVVRNAELWLFLIFFPLILIDFIYAFFNKKKQRLAELLSKTSTIEVLSLR